MNKTMSTKRVDKLLKNYEHASNAQIDSLIEGAETADLNQIRSLLLVFSETLRSGGADHAQAAMALAEQVPGLLRLLEEERLAAKLPF